MRVSWANELLAIELNSGNDNRLSTRSVERRCLGATSSRHPALAMDLVKIGGRLGGGLVDRQFALLVDRHNSMGLPDTLVAYEAVA